MLPDNLLPSQKMLLTAFPEGVGRDEYFAVIRLLHADYSLRNLATVIAASFRRDYSEVYGCDIGRALEMQFSPDVLDSVRARLAAAGLEECIRDDVST